MMSYVLRILSRRHYGTSKWKCLLRSYACGSGVQERHKFVSHHDLGESWKSWERMKSLTKVTQ